MVLILTLITAAVLSFGFYKLVTGISEKIISSYYLTDESEVRRKERYLESFQSFVISRKVESGDLKTIGDWTIHERYIRIIIYDENMNPVVESGPRGASFVDTGSRWMRYSDTTSQVEFADGVFNIAVFGNSLPVVWQVMDILSLALSFLLFIFILLVYNSRVLKALKTLRNEANSVAAGDFKHEITIRGTGEISELASDIDRMRESIIKGMETERSLIRTNTELITSISHDIRTPLTALIGYLDMIKAHQYGSREDLDKYTDSGLQKAMQIKDLTDELFGYFLVYGKGTENLIIEEYNGLILLQQLLGEHIIDLENNGFTVRTTPPEKQFLIHIDVNSLKRVFDNLFSNIEKYADRSREITVTGRLEEDRITISIVNRIPRTAAPRESTQIGLRTCEQLLSQFGGRLQTVKEGDRFTAEVMLPTEPGTSDPD